MPGFPGEQPISGCSALYREERGGGCRDRPEAQGPGPDPDPGAKPVISPNAVRGLPSPVKGARLRAWSRRSSSVQIAPLAFTVFSSIVRVTGRRPPPQDRFRGVRGARGTAHPGYRRMRERGAGNEAEYRRREEGDPSPMAIAGKIGVAPWHGFSRISPRLPPPPPGGGGGARSAGGVGVSEIGVRVSPAGRGKPPPLPPPPWR